jgi:uncharacterized iron-regulated protein
MWILFLACFVSAQEYIVNTHSGEHLSPAAFAASRAPGEIVVFGETHATSRSDRDTIAHHQRQVLLFELLGASGVRVRSAMEFLTYTDQSVVDQYSQGLISEADFLQRAHWSSGNPFMFYREQILLPSESGGRCLALNIPREVADQVAAGGPDSLSAEQRQLLPPVWERGSDAYFERFREAMEGHVSEAELENYFWAQSLWDDTMAWNTLKEFDPLAVTVIIVGNFHVEFGQGLPARLVRQGALHVTTLLQSEGELADDPAYGPHADFIWVH